MKTIEVPDQFAEILAQQTNRLSEILRARSSARVMLLRPHHILSVAMVHLESAFLGMQAWSEAVECAIEDDLDLGRLTEDGVLR